MFLPLVYGAALSFAAALLLTPLCRFVAIRAGYIAHPRGDRWHRKPTALYGGVGIALSVFLAQGLLAGPRALPIPLLGAVLIFGLGLLDDLVSLRAYTKLVVEIAISSLFVFFGYRLGWSSSLTLDTLLTMLWIVGLTNALNLLDNMDGLAAGVGLIAGAWLLATFVVNGGVTPEATYLAILLGAIAGFLVYNIYPASIFMGDSGSLFIGLNLAVLTLVSPNVSRGRTDVLSIMAGPVLILLIPIFDTTLVTVLRIFSGRSAAQGGRDHSSHRLVAMGLSERAAVAVLWTLGALGGALTLAIHGVGTGWASVGAVVFVLAMIIFAVYLAQVRVYEHVDDTLLKSGRITPFVLDFVYRRRAAEVLLDLCLASVAYYAAYRLRFEGPEFRANFQTFLQSLPLVVGIQSVALFAVGGYRGVWRYFGLMDGVTFAEGVFAGTLANVLAVVSLFGFESYSRGVFVIYAALLLLLLIGSRASFRLMSEFIHRRRQVGPRLVIYGAGAVGASAVRDLLGRRPGGYRMVGFIDDDPGMARASMQGYPVLGAFDTLTSLIGSGAVDIVVIAHRVDGEKREALRRLCAGHEVGLAELQLTLDQLVVGPDV